MGNHSVDETLSALVFGKHCERMTHYNYIEGVDPDILWHPMAMPEGKDIAILLPYFTREPNYLPIGVKDGKWVRCHTGSTYPAEAVVGWIFPENVQ
mgnify:CR=1 FL=1